MIKLILVLAFILTSLLVSGCSKKTETSTPPTDLIIDFTNNTYSPNIATIKVGQTITFNNKSNQDIWPASNIHPTHGVYPQFDPKGVIAPGQSWSFTFTKAGIWKFHDHKMPQITGEITVE